LAQVIIQSGKQAGEVTLKAGSNDLKGALTKIKGEYAVSRPSVARNNYFEPD
jgi:hypothetical protein